MCLLFVRVVLINTWVVRDNMIFFIFSVTPFFQVAYDRASLADTKYANFMYVISIVAERRQST